MFRKNELKEIVLQCVQEMNEATSREISKRMGYFRVSDRKKVSMTLLKCKRQRLLDRTLLKRGRVREYFYVLTERGRKRLAYYRSKEGKVKFGVLNINEIVKAAKKQADLLSMSAMLSSSCAECICSNTKQTDVFSKVQQFAILSADPIIPKQELTSAFAAIKLLELVSPETSAMIQNATKELANQDLDSVMEMFTIGSGIKRLNSLSPPIDDNILWLLAIRKMRELNLGQLLLCRDLKKEENEKKKYKHLYESEKKRRIILEEIVDSYNESIFDAYKYTLQSVMKIYGSTQSIIETDQKIIKHLVKERAGL